MFGALLVQDVDEEMTPEVRSGLLCGSCETMQTLTASIPPEILDVVVTYFVGWIQREAELPGTPKKHLLRRQVDEGSTESS